jgi:4-hydroxybenzoate polyprenyltransferase
VPEETKINPLIAFLKLIRVENLLIIAATQYLLEYFVVEKVFYYPDQVLKSYYAQGGLQPPMHFGMQLSHFHFFLLSLSTVMIAAAGYIINDYFDVKTDRINKPGRIVIDRGIKRRVAMVAHTVINVLGIGIGFYVGYKAGNLKLGLIHVLTAILLWFYSTNFKKMFFIGNIIVALLTALVPIIVAVYEAQALKMNSETYSLINSLYKAFVESVDIDFRIPLYYSLVFGLFAFLTNLMREIVKDMEDFVGDMETGGRTVPVLLGYTTTKNIVHVINVFTIILLSAAAMRFATPEQEFVWYKLNKERDLLSSLYLFILLIIPLIVFSVMLRRSDTPKKYRKAGMFLKFVMLAGILFSLVIWYSYTKESN